MDAPRPALSGIAAVLALLALSACGSSSGAATATGSQPPTAAPIPPATTPQAAVSIVQQWAAALNHNNLTLFYLGLPPIEEGPALEMDTAKDDAYVGAVASISPFTLSDITTVVPQDGTYPTSFLAETTLHTSTGATKYLLVFAKDDAGSAWKLAAYLSPASGASFPSFALNAQGYGKALDAATMHGYPATVPGLAAAYCNYLGTSFGSTKQVPNAPSITFAAGPDTSTLVNMGTLSTNTIRHAGGTSDGTYAPETYVWAYKLADGSALAIATVQTTLDQTAGPNTQLSVPAIYPFVTAGAYSTTRSASEGTFGIVEPTSGPTVSVTMQDIQFTHAQAS
ncbi:MAG: hypothetical protein ABI352_03915 [Candidatus Dormibacter sp.]